MTASAPFGCSRKILPGSLRKPSLKALFRKSKNTTMETIKKIAIVSDAVYPFNKGGKEKRMYDVSTRLAARGHDVTIYCMKWWEGEDEIIRDGVRLSAISPHYPLYAGGRRSIKEAIFFSLHCFK